MGQVNKNKRCLLVTGTIVPNSNFVSHTNVEQRLKEYYDALLFYRTEFPDEAIYFLENSSYDLSKNEEFQKLFANGNVKLLKCPVSDKFEQGKGYQEFEMLDAAVKTLSGTFYSFIKITGRYKVQNLKQITGSEPKNIFIDCQKKPAVAQTNVFYSTFDFYNRNIAGLYKNADDSKGNYIEKEVYKKIISGELLAEVNPFAHNPVILGVSGSYGGTLNRNKWKLRARNVERAIMRILGIKQFLVEY